MGWSHMKGKPPWNKGLRGKQTAWNKGRRDLPKQSEESNKKRSLALTGIKRGPMTEEHRRKDSESKKRFFANGGKHGMLGKKHTPEAKKKIGMASVGRIPSLATRAKMRKLLSGSNGPGWKGGITSENKRQRSLFRRTMQKAVFERDDYICQICLERGGILQVDHIKSWADYPELRFVMDNCRTLCVDCHYEITFGVPMPSTTKTLGQKYKDGLGPEG